jgi:UDP-N-acetylglucosamine 1-carboxyvinyltransferase
VIELIRKLGGKIDWVDSNSLKIDPSSLSSYVLDPDDSIRIRASVVLAAPLLARFGRAVVTPPGGDQIGERLLDTHFVMLRNFGVDIQRKNGKYYLSWKKRTKQSLFLEESSVTATEMGLMLSSSLPFETQIDDAAGEPHIIDLIELLAKMGSKIKVEGGYKFSVWGKKRLKGTTHRVVPDHIEGGTFIIASAITGGRVVIDDFVPEHYRMILHYLKNMGVDYKLLGKDKLLVLPSELKAYKSKFQTRPWPGFPTDLMSPFIVLATQSEGTILCHDWMYEWRMFFVDDLISMGAKIFIADPHRVIISGATPLSADILFCKDIRAGISVILAALCAKGQSVIDNIEMVDRGYEDIEGRLIALGANIKKVEEQ